MKKILSLCFIASVLLAACQPAAQRPAPNGGSPPAAQESAESSQPVEVERISLGAGYGARGPWFEVYFTNPQSPLAAQLTGGIDAPLAAAIDSARLSVDVAVYSLSLNSVRDALINAHRRGVRVRVVMESDNLDRADPQRLKDAGIPVLGDRREGLMHNKFAVIDGAEVWFGSMNFTDSGAYKDNNHLIRVRSRELAADYEKEFEEMFSQDLFGQNVLSETPYPRVTIEDAALDVYFSPDDGVQANLLNLLYNVEQSVYFLAFSFTADEIGAALRELTKHGVKTAGVMEEEQIKSNAGTEFDLFRQAKMDVRADGNEGQMHHKVMVIDESVVVTGSYNFTNSAETRNDENLVVLYDKRIAALFLEEFARVYEQAKK